MKVAERVSDVSKVAPERRRRALLALAVAGMLLVPAAISWACGPNRAIQTDRVSYAPGQTVQITGANFEPFASVDIKLNGSAVTSTQVSATGNIATSITAPSAAGTYALRTDGVDQEGQSLAGTGNTVTFTVTAASTPTPGGGSGGGGGSGSGSGTTSPGSGTAAPAPGVTSGGQRGSSGANSRGVSGGERLGLAPANRGINTTEGQITADGTTAFAGSVTRATRAEVAERATGRNAGNAGAGARPSERSAGADLWSGLASSKNPSLLPADGAGAPKSDTGSGLAWALALLGAGALALAGLGVAEARRRSKATVR